MVKTPAELLAERSQRIKDAYALKKPDRMPIAPNFGYMLARLGGITNQELEANVEKAGELFIKYAQYLNIDMAGSAGFGYLPQPSIMLGDRQTKWPGYSLGPDEPFQYVEGEYMKAEDYDAFLEDPTDFTIRTFLPRAYSELEGLADLPRMSIMLLGYAALRNLRMLTQPRIAAAFTALSKTSQMLAQSGEAEMAVINKIEASGFPMSLGSGSFGIAPFDYMSDTLRGMRGILTDIYRRPDKLLASMEKVVPIVVETAVSAARRTGNPYCFIPLHRGSDGFMSIQQFEKFYWPPLKAMLLQMIEGGVTPSVFFEGSYNERLRYLSELPRGKVIGRFDRSDLFKVKEVLGDTMCIVGGFPVSLLQGGTAEQIREHTRQLCQVVGNGGGFIMGPNTYMSDCKLDLVKVWVDATKEFGA